MNKDTSGRRLKTLIQRQGYKMRDFAEITGVAATTLSKFVNDSLPMSDKYINRASEVLRVSPAFIKCETDDKTPVEYITYSNSMSQEQLDLSKQNYLFRRLEAFLESMGIEIIWKASNAKTKLIQRDNRWYKLSGNAAEIDEIGMNSEEFEKLVSENNDTSVWVELTYRGKTRKMTNTEYNYWLKGFTNLAILKIQSTFDEYFDISNEIHEADWEKALKKDS